MLGPGTGATGICFGTNWHSRRRGRDAVASAGNAKPRL